jgi:hypothetical protein
MGPLISSATGKNKAIELAQIAPVATDLKTRSSPDSLAACPRGFAFYLAVAVGYVPMPATTWSSSR